MPETGPPGRSPTPTARRLAAFVATAALAAAACSHSNDTTAATSTRPASPAPTAATDSAKPSTTVTAVADSTGTTSGGTSPSSTNAGSADPARQAIVDAYLGYWQARFAANSGTPNPSDPGLAEHATGSQLEAVVKETQANLDQGRAFRRAAKPAGFRKVTVVSVDGDRAVVQECFVDDDQVIDRTTGNVVDASVTTQSVSGTLRLVSGRWKVAGTQLVQEWEGVAGCALAS